jgi:septum formation protein
MLKAIGNSNNFRSAYALLKVSSRISRYKVVMMSTDFSSLVKTAPRIILGSSSSSRRQLMDEVVAEHGFKYEVLTADIDEKAIRVEDPRELVMKLAHAKADAIIEKLKTAEKDTDTNDNIITGLLITCDQVVTHEGRILEKPQDADEAREFISGYGRAPASTVGSTVCTNLATGQRLERLDIATIHFSHIPEETAEILIKEGDVMWCAGGLMVEHPLVVPHVQKMEGGQDAVMGLSKSTLVKLITEALS